MRRIALLFVPVLVFAQSFDVASIKASPSGLEGHDINSSAGGYLTTSNTSLKNLVTFAYGLRDFQVSGGPKWIDSEHYDLTAKCSGCPAKIAGPNFQSMVQALLADRFRLVVHNETKEGPILELVVARSGPKMTESGPDSLGPATQGRQKGVVITMTATKIDMARLANYLSRQLGRTVVDRSGLKAQYDFTLRWTPDAAGADTQAESEFPSLFTALQEQLGLRLETGKGPVETLVIDSAEKPAAN